MSSERSISKSTLAPAARSTWESVPRRWPARGEAAAPPATAAPDAAALRRPRQDDAQPRRREYIIYLGRLRALTPSLRNALVPRRVSMRRRLSLVAAACATCVLLWRTTGYQQLSLRGPQPFAATAERPPPPVPPPPRWPASSAPELPPSPVPQPSLPRNTPSPSARPPRRRSEQPRLRAPGNLSRLGMARCSNGSPLPRQPHVIVLMADDLGMSDLGYTGSSFIRTPTIDTLARHAVHLANFFAPTWCAPARTALLTGRVPWEVGVTAALSEWPVHRTRRARCRAWSHLTRALCVPVTHSGAAAGQGHAFA